MAGAGRTWYPSVDPPTRNETAPVTRNGEPRILSRLVWLLVATLQVTLGVVATIAEARFLVDAELGGGNLHVEAEGPRHNPPAHPDDCGVCHHLSSRSSIAEPVQLAGPPVTTGANDEFAPADQHDLAGGLTLPLARAPPLS